MKILLVNKYFHLKGGSEKVFFNEANLLQNRGHQVIFFSMRDGRNISCAQSDYFINRIDYEQPAGIKEQLRQSLKILYSFEAKKKIEKLIEREKPEIAHLHNIYHQISPSIIHSLKKYGIPIVMTLHDYKMVCPSYAMWRNGQICERCRQGRHYWCFLTHCTKGSYAKSLLNVMEMYLHHQILHVYDLIDVFISPSRFLLGKVKEMGFKNKISHVPYSFDVGYHEPKYTAEDNTFCYFGRLSPEKGLFTLLAAVKRTKAELKIIGEGPLKEKLIAKVREDDIKGINFLGYKSGEALNNEVKSSLAVIIPSEWYENYPNVILESFAFGKPVVGARIGGIPELVKDGETGLTFNAGDSDDLRQKIRLLLRDRDLVVRMGKRARKFIEENLNPEKHYQDLINVYRTVLGR